MTNLNQLLTRPLRRLPVSAVVFLLVVALAGFVDASYLTIEHFQGAIPPCSLTGGCETVLSSPFSTFLGIPVSLLGALYYLTILICAFAYLEGKHEWMMRFALWFTVFGLAASLWFVYLQVFVIHSYCVYCIGSAITSTVLFVTAMEILKKFTVHGDKLSV
ncbi:vitamin K epoxide reductase family protein [Patescibacteria group bacterium]|nr:vitamin K epoxide reductase family protein [Patescibacteria group bacterium]MDE1946432.1 vitamin K epoxide reductase family protein [Patescibacteria group bacterium]MDE2011041.1 vitamin K epoxide reductase family protein [Patescibacteria group bacterium]MDE2233631.1 vitamin K epoxide reductase family protein [Patescibacteria group bacterium]